VKDNKPIDHMNNIMNSLTKILLFSSLVGLFFSCGDDKVMEETTPYFGVAGNEMEQAFTGASETRYVTVNTNCTFSATSSDPSWCVVEIVEDKVDNLKITVNKNDEVHDRTAQITVSSAGFDNVVITVKQGWNALLTTDKSYLLLNNDNLTFTLKVNSNIDYVLELPSWINEKEKQANGTHLFEFAPIAPGERSGNIVIKSTADNPGVSLTVTVIQRERIKKVASWLFDDPANLTKATVGKALEMVRNISFNPNAQFLSVEGPTESNKAVRIPVNCHFVADHGMIPKEGQNYVAEYTLFFEFKIPVVGRFYSFFQTELANTADAEIFVRSAVPPTIGVGATGYAGGGLIVAEKWHRLYLSFKPGDVKFFIDGQQFHSSTTADSRFRMSTAGVILCGGPWTKKDDNEFDIAEISIWNGALTLDNVKELEGI